MPFRCFSSANPDVEDEKLGVVPAPLVQIKHLRICDGSENIERWAKLNFPFNNFMNKRSTSVDRLSLLAEKKDHIVMIGHSQAANRLPRLANRIGQLNSIVISVSRRRNRLSIVNDVTKKNLYVESHFLWGFAKSISVSTDKTFFSVDFDFGVTKIYRATISKSVTVSYISELSSAHPMSAISGGNFLCATASSRRLVIWDIILGTIHRVVEYPKEIVKVVAHEESFAVWVATGQNIILMDLNGQELRLLDLGDVITVLEGMEDGQSVVCGTRLGKIFVVGFEEAGPKCKELDSPHGCEIEKVIVEKKRLRFTSVDVKGEVKRWDLKGGVDSDAMVFASCAVCTNPTMSVCVSCGKPMCDQCLAGHLKGPDCRHCFAFL
jgi:hypothetical protein